MTKRTDVTDIGMNAKQQHVRITSDGALATVLVDGVDVSCDVVGYQVEHHSKQMPTVVLVLNPHATNTLFDGRAHVVVGDEAPPGEATAEFLSGIDPAALDRAALNRDLDGSSNELTKAMLAQLIDWALGRTGG
jgi:hypothetical protein